MDGKGNPSAPHRRGLVDHDSDLRHSILGCHQIAIAAILLVQGSMSFLLGRGVNPRQMVFPSVMLLGLVAQNRLWRRGRDRAATHVLVGGLVAATAVSLGVASTPPR